MQANNWTAYAPATAYAASEVARWRFLYALTGQALYKDKFDAIAAALADLPGSGIGQPSASFYQGLGLAILDPIARGRIAANTLNLPGAPTPAEIAYIKTKCAAGSAFSKAADGAVIALWEEKACYGTRLSKLARSERERS